MKYIVSNKKGVTLIELLISIAILGILIIGFLPMFTGSVVNIYNYGERYQHFSVAQGILEEELEKDYEELLLGTSEIDINPKLQIVTTITEKNINNTNALIIKINALSTENIKISGKEIEVKLVHKDKEKTLTTLTSFVPDPDFQYDIEN